MTLIFTLASDLVWLCKNKGFYELVHEPTALAQNIKTKYFDSFADRHNFVAECGEGRGRLTNFETKVFKRVAALCFLYRHSFT